MNARGPITLTILLLAATGTLLLFARPPAPTPSPPDAASDEATPTPALDTPATAPDIATRPTQEPAAQLERTQASDLGRTNRGAEWSVLVVDPSRRPIADAQVDLVEIRPAGDNGGSKRKARLHGSERSGKDGMARFAIPQGAERFGIIASADGWLRKAVPPPVALLEAPSTPLVLVLQRGRQLRGRVVDPRGRSVPNLSMFAVTAGYGVDHVSLSSISLRAQDRYQDPRNAKYQQSRATTAADGSVVFDGIPAGAKMSVRSDDPAWRIVGYQKVPGDAPSITWTAAPAFGVVVRVRDAARRPVPASARFCVDLDLADGSRKNASQWVGKGIGSLRFSFHEGLLPGLEELDVVRAIFYGTVSTLAGTKSWRAPPILNPKQGGVAELEVLVPTSGPDDERSLAVRPTMQLALDVLGGDGQPYADPVQVAWSSATRTGNPRGDTRAEFVRPGIYLAGVPVPSDIEDLEVRIQPVNASGSLAPWTKLVPAIPDRQQSLRVRLPPSGGVVILRPARWTSAWTVRATYRNKPADPWQGAWTYSTRDDRLTLSSVLPAEWRFELVQNAPARSTTVETRVRAGDQLVVGG